MLETPVHEIAKAICLLMAEASAGLTLPNLVDLFRDQCDPNGHWALAERHEEQEEVRAVGSWNQMEERKTMW